GGRVEAGAGPAGRQGLDQRGHGGGPDAAVGLEGEAADLVVLAGQQRGEVARRGRRGRPERRQGPGRPHLLEGGAGQLLAEGGQPVGAAVDLPQGDSRGGPHLGRAGSQLPGQRPGGGAGRRPPPARGAGGAVADPSLLEGQRGGQERHLRRAAAGQRQGDAVAGDEVVGSQGQQQGRGGVPGLGADQPQHARGAAAGGRVLAADGGQ